MVVVALCGSSSCYYDETSSGSDGSGGGDSAQISSTGGQSPGLTEDGPASPNEDPGGSSASGDYDDVGFDPCPEVKYVLWEDENGQKFVVVIEVFCDPMQNINMGCPILKH